MSNPIPTPVEQAVLNSPEFAQYLDARTELIRLSPFIDISPTARTFEQLYQRYVIVKLARI